MAQYPTFRVSSCQPETAKTACIAVGVFQSRKLSPAAVQLDKASNGYIQKILKKGDFVGNAGDTQVLYDLPGVAAQRVILVGCGKQNKLNLATFFKINSAFAQQAARLKLTEATSFLCEIDSKEIPAADRYQLAVIACRKPLYEFSEFKSKDSENQTTTLKKISLAQSTAKSSNTYAKATASGQAIAMGIDTARDLGNLPGNKCTPSYLAKKARSLQTKYKTIKTTVIDEAGMKKLKMGSFLAVGQGSREPSKLIIMEYRSGDKKKKPLVLVGKGVTFDSGGISLKPGAQMDEMKFDMCGAASVMGAMTACAEMKLKANVVGVIAGVENMPGGNAIKPGDIVTSMSGKTIEILNTDAEGRLILCDALTYIDKFNPAAVIDIATLTGACIIALGRVPSGMFCNDEKLAEKLTAAGERCGDRVWNMPLWPEYKELLRSNFADIANIGNREAGSITAASFLSYFTEKYRWAHIDIAGTAWNTGSEKGATGRPVSLLMEYIMSHHSTS